MSDTNKIAETVAVLTDHELEKQSHPVGSVIHVSTVTHAFRGTLFGVTPTHYLLKDAFIIHSTGDVAEYSKSATSKANEMEACHCTVRIPRAAVAWEFVW